MKMYLANEEIQASSKPDKTVGSLQSNRRAPCGYAFIDFFMYFLAFLFALRN